MRGFVHGKLSPFFRLRLSREVESPRTVIATDPSTGTEGSNLS